MNLKGKNALITGGGRGLGKAVAVALANEGVNVGITGRNEESLKTTVAELEKLGVKAAYSVFDVEEMAQVEQGVASIASQLGSIDILINNAGVGITGPIEEIPTEEIRNNFETNLFGPIEVMKAVLPQMRAQKSGLIINITSIAGYMGLPYRGIYSASKGALELITEALRMEVKSFGIQITNVAPGDFATNIAAGRYHAPVVKGSAYEVPYGNTLKEMDSHVDSGSNPNEMAEAIFAIIQTDKPKVHYKVGAFMQKFSIVLKRILPDTVYEKMLMNHYKL